MKKLLFSSLFTILLLFIGCNNSVTTNPLIKREHVFIKSYERSRNETLNFYKRKNAIDSLITEAKKSQNDSLLITSIGYKSYLFKTIKVYDSALYFAKQMYNKSRTSNDTILMAKSLFKIGLYNYRNQNWLDAFEYYNKSKNLFSALGDSSEVGKKLLTIAVIQKKLGDFKGSEITSIDALRFLRNYKDRKYRTAIYNHLGITSKEQKNYKEARYWYGKALQIATDTIAILNLKNNKAVAEIKLQNFKTAISKLTPLLLYPNLAHEPKLAARILDNLAYAKSKLHYPEAETELQEALKIRKTQNDLSGQFASHIHLTRHYKDRFQTPRALQHATQALHIANRLKGAEGKLEALSHLIDLKKNPKSEAIAYRTLKDSLVTARNRAKNQFAKLKYDTDKNREENFILKTQTAQKDLELAKKTITRNWWIFISFLFGIGLLSLIFRWRQRIKIAALNATSKTETRISKKVHDELANDISDIMTTIEHLIPTTNPKKEPLLNSLETVYERTRDIATETGALVLEKSFDKSLKELLMQHHKQDVKVITNIDIIRQIQLDDHKKNAIYRALQELMVNMKKHSQATRVSIIFKKQDKHHEIWYKDNGVGTDTIHFNNGLQNAESRMQDIGGSFTFESTKGNGFKAILKFSS